MPGWIMPLYTTMLMAAFLLFGQAVRSNKIEGRGVVLVGGGIGLVATIASYLLLMASAPGGKVPLGAVLGNSLLMAVATGIAVAVSLRQQRVDDLRTETVGATTVIVRQCSAFRIRDLDALILPNTTALATLESDRRIAKMAPRIQDRLRRQAALQLERRSTGVPRY